MCLLDGAVSDCLLKFANYTATKCQCCIFVFFKLLVKCQQLKGSSTEDILTSHIWKSTRENCKSDNKGKLNYIVGSRYCAC